MIYAIQNQNKLDFNKFRTLNGSKYKLNTTKIVLSIKETQKL